ncbi:hypothetical protein [Chitinophaga sp.]|uniref:hypothetical protein n=1 Tax=Chitinophaga sp. TaxID=1869181 RepID=UPI0031D592A6
MNRNLLLFIFGALCILGALYIYGRQTGWGGHLFNDGNFSYHVMDSDNTYEIKAQYNRAQTDKVRAYLQEQLGPYTNLSFRDVELDATTTLKNGAIFYILLKPGRLRIKLNKKENSQATYERFSQMGRELRPVMSRQ